MSETQEAHAHESLAVRVEHGDDYIFGVVKSEYHGPREPPERGVYFDGHPGDELFDADELRTLAEGLNDAAKWLDAAGHNFDGSIRRRTLEEAASRDAFTDRDVTREHGDRRTA